jgi:hypothetical protein
MHELTSAYGLGQKADAWGLPLRAVCRYAQVCSSAGRRSERDAQLNQR